MNNYINPQNFIMVLILCLGISYFTTAQGEKEYPAGIINQLIIDPEYHNYLEIYSFLDSMVALYPNITHLDTSWTSQFQGLKIPVLKISDNPEIEEDEPAVGYDGLIHPREPTPGEICLKLIAYLLSNYGSDLQVTQWINNTEIFIIPMLNPDGWKYVTEEASINPWWLKNQRDNDNNQVFNPNIDGVNINRNFDYCWENGNNSPGSWGYAGPEPFSEKETQLKRKYAIEQKYVMSINYHSKGQFIACYNNYNGIPSPEFALFYHIADKISERIPNYNSPGHYYIKNVDCDMGYSDCWMYVKNGTIECTIETAPEFVPSGPAAQQIAEDNIDGALYLLDRVFGPGITGHIYDPDGNPIIAAIRILEIQDTFCTPRTSDSLYGRFFRPLLPGEYTVEVSTTDDTLVEIIEVPDDTLAYHDFYFPPIRIEEVSIPGDHLEVYIYPNPSSNATSICFTLHISHFTIIDLYTINGRIIRRILEENIPSGKHETKIDISTLPAGVYFIKIQAGGEIAFRKLIVNSHLSTVN